MPLSIKLISMPFGRLVMPSVALSQLKAVTEKRFGDRVHIDTHYLSIDFAKRIGDAELYDYPLCPHGYTSGAGDWYFRQAAFPDAPDNTQEYFDRFQSHNTDLSQGVKEFLEGRSSQATVFLDEMIEKYDLLDADLVGFTMLFAQTTASIALARRLKEKKPDMIIAAGGATCEGILGCELSRQIECFDAVFSGPGLISFPEFVDCCLENDMERAAAIRGVFMGGNGDEDEAGDDLDINENIILDYDGFLDHLGEAFPGVQPRLLFETSRGCWWGEKVACSFCGLNGIWHTYRAMTPENARKQIESLYRFCDRCSVFMAVDNALPTDYIDHVFPHLEAPANMAMHYELRADLSEDDIQKLCSGNMTMAQPGVEALNTTSLKLMRKGTTAFGNLIFLKNCSRQPFTVNWNMLLFSPDEPEEVCEKYVHDIPLFAHLPPPDTAFPVMIIRYSKYFREAEEMGMELKPLDSYGMIYPFDEEAITNMAYHFVDLNADDSHHANWLKVINEKIGVWHQRWFGWDGMPQARLVFEQDERSHILYDSRSGEVVEREMSAREKELLAYLEKHATLDMVRDRFSGQEDFDVEAALERLIEQGIVFEEDRKFLSLVC